jgi:2-polyprenyl-6-methoxyphenol hydroxylase-like FAD-dependent oxidoreductase
MPTSKADGVTVEVATPGGAEQIQAAYVIGCDGGRSTVRKRTGLEFGGSSYPERFIKIATLFDFERVVPDLCYRNYFSDPDEWASLFKVGGETKGGLWRCLFPVRPDESDEAAPAPAVGGAGGHFRACVIAKQRRGRVSLYRMRAQVFYECLPGRRHVGFSVNDTHSQYRRRCCGDFPIGDIGNVDS